MENTSTIVLSKSRYSQLQDAMWCAVFVAEALAIVIGNFFVLLVFTTTPRLRMRRAYLLLSLSLADLLVGLIALPFWIYQSGSRTRLWDPPLSREGFIAYCILDLFTSLASISNLAVISLERFYATFCPWRHRAVDKSKYLQFVIVVWCLSAVSSAMYAVVRFAVQSTILTLYTWLPYFCVLLLVICFSYTAIFFKVRRSHHRSRMDRERKLTTTMFMATMFSLVAYLPLVVVGIFYFALQIQISDLVMTVLSFLNFGNCLVNPVLYSFRMPEFRKAVCSLFCSKRRQHAHARLDGQVVTLVRNETPAIISSPVTQRKNSVTTL